MRRLIPLGVLAAVALAFLTACSPSGAITPTPSVSPSRVAVRCPGNPTPACTGVPPGTKLVETPLTEAGAYRVTKPGDVLDGVHIAGDLLVAADDVTIRNSQIDGLVINALGPRTFRYTIADSTIGPATGCQSLPGVGQDKYTAIRLHIRNHGDGFRVGGDNVVIHDSFVRLCSNPDDHSDGIQTYGGGKGLIFNHNTVDQRGVKDITAPIFLTDPRIENAVVTNNLVMGGTYSIQLRNGRGKLVMRGNKLVDKSWVYGPVDSDCGKIDWADNTLVTIDENYRVTSTVGPLNCVG
ncbi:right-handed parallel beta-helix repeat-containing protein [Streptosporangium sp. NPDC051023]|uniref:right-handed parallel beta-helix repeat-containing protein n=1 Tax=Streptosporangium sp. NPDC051023 TaxID=3155410 RepID=UPI00344BD900